MAMWLSVAAHIVALMCAEFHRGRHSRAHSGVYMGGSGVSAHIMKHVRAGLVPRGTVFPPL